MKLAGWIIGLSLLLTSPVAAQEAGENQARNGDLMALQLWTSDVKRFHKEWEQPTPPNLTTTTSAQRNEPIYLMILFAGCKVDDSGNCKLSGRVTITDPDGLPYGDPVQLPEWSSPRPNPQAIYLSPDSMGLTIEAGEKLGTYRISVQVTDENAGISATTYQTITVSEALASPA
ncbi:MAG: hypothetical protein IE933_12570 [Sphingomonadales bacterium]|nr:hypothetical protein [Sphingomonadales bacterium]MBD3774660.1 hypothetical protein [Paracoccaceae bacterium]